MPQTNYAKGEYEQCFAVSDEDAKELLIEDALMYNFPLGSTHVMDPIHCDVGNEYSAAKFNVFLASLGPLLRGIYYENNGINTDDFNLSTLFVNNPGYCQPVPPNAGAYRFRPRHHQSPYPEGSIYNYQKCYENYPIPIFGTQNGTNSQNSPNQQTPVFHNRNKKFSQGERKYHFKGRNSTNNQSRVQNNHRNPDWRYEDSDSRDDVKQREFLSREGSLLNAEGRGTCNNQRNGNTGNQNMDTQWANNGNHVVEKTARNENEKETTGNTSQKCEISTQTTVE